MSEACCTRRLSRSLLLHVCRRKLQPSMVIIHQRKQRSKCTGVGDQSRTRGISGSSSAGRRGLVYWLMGWDLYTDSADCRGAGLIVSRDLQGMRQEWRYSTVRKLRCSVASRTVHSGLVQGGWGRCSFHSSTGRLQSPRPSGAPAWRPASLLTKRKKSSFTW